MDLLGSILGSMEKPPVAADADRKRAKEHQKQLEKIKEKEKEKINSFRKKIQEKINDFLKDSTREKYKFQPMEKVHRALVHEVAEVAGLTSFSFGQDEVDRYVMVWKKEFAPCDDELTAYRKGEEWGPEQAKLLAQQRENERLEEEARKKESKNQMAPSGLPYKAKYERILSAANSAEKISSSNRAYGCVSSENKRDRRTIEEVMAESRARKKQKTEGATDDATQDNDADDGSGTLSL